MKKSFKVLAFIFALALALSIAAPALSLTASDYNSHDVNKLRAFFALQGNSPYTNGQAMNGSGYSIDDPSTWDACTWTSAGRLATLTFDNLGWQVVGELDLSGCTGLTELSGTDCSLTGLNVSGCTSLTLVNVTGNSITSINVSNTPALGVLWFKSNTAHTISSPRST